MNVLKEVCGLVFYIQCVLYGEVDVGFTGPYSSLFSYEAYLCVAMQIQMKLLA